MEIQKKEKFLKCEENSRKIRKKESVYIWINKKRRKISTKILSKTGKTG